MKNDSRKVLLSQVSKNFDFWPFKGLFAICYFKRK
jgi:hypothetical protein